MAAAVVAQEASHAVAQQKGSTAHTIASHAGLSQPGAPPATQQLPGGGATPQMSAASAAQTPSHATSQQKVSIEQTD